MYEELQHNYVLSSPHDQSKIQAYSALPTSDQHLDRALHKLPMTPSAPYGDYVGIESVVRWRFSRIYFMVQLVIIKISIPFVMM